MQAISAFVTAFFSLMKIKQAETNQCKVFIMNVIYLISSYLISFYFILFYHLIILKRMLCLNMFMEIK